MKIDPKCEMVHLSSPRPFHRSIDSAAAHRHRHATMRKFERLRHIRYFTNSLQHLPTQYSSADTNRLTLVHFCVHCKFVCFIPLFAHGMIIVVTNLVCCPSSSSSSSSSSTSLTLTHLLHFSVGYFGMLAGSGLLWQGRGGGVH